MHTFCGGKVKRAKLTRQKSQHHATNGAEGLGIFKDFYVLVFLDLPAGHAEADLHRALLLKLKNLLIELGRDFCFVGSDCPLQVGGRRPSTCCSSTAD